MLSDRRIKTLVDYPKSRDCFQSVDIAGGVMYFLWDNSYCGDCVITSMTNGNSITTVRSLNAFEIFIRDNIGIGIIHKVLALNETAVSNRVLTRNSFGFTTSDRGEKSHFDDSVTLVSSSGVSYVPKSSILKNKDLVGHYKVSIGTLNPDRGGVNNARDKKMNVTTKIKLLKPNEVVTETYIIIDCFTTRSEAENCVGYLSTRFARFLISLTLSSMHIVRGNFQFVPIQDFSEPWTDEKLYAKYSLTNEEISYIESMVRPMDLIKTK